MPDLQERMEKMLFNYQTTNRTDFRGGQILPPTFTKYKEKPKYLNIRPPPLKDHHTLAAWKTVAVPFSLMHAPKPITGTDPTKVQEPYVKPPDLEKEESIRTRPRLVMTPAVSMDDVTNPRARQILTDYMYTSSMTSATREAISDYFTVKAPLPGLPAPANPIKLPKLTLPYVSPEWRMETVPWDSMQLRTYCDTTKEFWLGQKLPPCQVCRDTEIVDADRKMRHQMRTDMDRAKVQKFRPKVVMKSPANDLDAIQEPVRKMIVDNIYLTTTLIAQREAVAGDNFKNVKAPLPNSYSKCRPVFIEPLVRRYISPEWRMDSLMWAAKQLRIAVDPTNHFWLAREKPYCSVCEDTTMRTALNKTSI